jgi:hypothetical protein
VAADEAANVINGTLASLGGFVNFTYLPLNHVDAATGQFLCSPASFDCARCAVHTGRWADTQARGMSLM